MTPSIIRRFARYHGMLHVDILDVEGQVLLLGERIYGSHGIAAVSRIIQSLTRIEDAEMALSIANMNSGVMPANRDAAFIAAQLFALAGIDETKWREVKE